MSLLTLYSTTHIYAYILCVCLCVECEGRFVTEMLHDQKMSKVKEATESALDAVLVHVMGNLRGMQNVNISTPLPSLAGMAADGGPFLVGGQQQQQQPEIKPKYGSIDDIFANTYKNEPDPQLRTVILDILVDHYNVLLASGTYYSPLQYSKQFKIPYKFFEAYWMSRKPETTGLHKSDYEECMDSRPKLKPKSVVVDQIVKMPSPEENPYYRYDPSPPPPLSSAPISGPSRMTAKPAAGVAAIGHQRELRGKDKDRLRGK